MQPTVKEDGSDEDGEWVVGQRRFGCLGGRLSVIFSF